jgi:glutathione reductase (NADPH)
MKDYDYIVIGGGSGGIASARRAAAHGAKVALVEARRIGGTCVLTGCVPKKLMFNAASIAETLADAEGYGFSFEPPRVDWATLKSRRDAAVERLVGIYEKNLDTAGVTTVRGRAKLLPTKRVGVHEVEIDGERISGRHVLIATGGSPRVPALPGAQLGITSNGFFELETQPKKIAVVGSGYVAMELAGIFQQLGTQVTVLSRTALPLERFDPMLREELLGHLKSTGVEFLPETEAVRLIRTDSSQLKLIDQKKNEHVGFDTVLWAVGRTPASAGLGLEGVGVETDAGGHIVVDEYQNTSAANVHALGDVTGKAKLTPVAIAAGRALSDRLFAGKSERKLDYENIPTVVFSHPPIATVGLTEVQARECFGDDVAVFNTRFTNLFHSLTKIRPKTAMKIVTQRSTDRVLGVHVIGRNADEMIQGVAIAVRMGATKADFDRTVAVHPTGAEELVTIP